MAAVRYRIFMAVSGLTNHPVAFTFLLKQPAPKQAYIYPVVLLGTVRRELYGRVVVERNAIIQVIL